MPRTRDLGSAFTHRWCCKVPLYVRRVVRTQETLIRCPKCRVEMKGMDRLKLEKKWNADVEKRRPPKPVEVENDDE